MSATCKKLTEMLLMAINSHVGNIIPRFSTFPLENYRMKNYYKFNRRKGLKKTETVATT